MWKNNVSVLIHINFTMWQSLVKKLIMQKFWQVKRPSNTTNFTSLTWRPFWFVCVYHKTQPIYMIICHQNKKVSTIFTKKYVWKSDHFIHFITDMHASMCFLLAVNYIVTVGRETWKMQLCVSLQYTAWKQSNCVDIWGWRCLDLYFNELVQFENSKASYKNQSYAPSSF